MFPANNRKISRPTIDRPAFALVAIVLAFAGPLAAAAEMPPRQAAFCKAVADGRAAYKAANQDTNRLRRDVNIEAARTSRRDALKAALPGELGGGEAEQWIGTVARVFKTSSGNGWLRVALPCGAALQSMSGVEIPAKDPLFKTLLGLDVGETVRVNGRMLAAAGECDHFVELSLTWGGAMESPDFAFYFEAVEPRDKPQAAR